mgnify:CR=1 FL=1
MHINEQGMPYRIQVMDGYLASQPEHSEMLHYDGENPLSNKRFFRMVRDSSQKDILGNVGNALESACASRVYGQRISDTSAQDDIHEEITEMFDDLSHHSIDIKDRRIRPGIPLPLEETQA